MHVRLMAPCHCWSHSNVLARASVVCVFPSETWKRRFAMRPILAIALCAAFLASPRAQAVSVAGPWTVTTEGARGTTADGSNWTLGAMTGTLTLTQKGDDLTGSWKGQMPAAWALTGRLTDGAFALE